jgi:ABC-2 type transport system ATP-binding protein
MRAASENLEPPKAGMALSVRGLTKRFGAFTAVNGISFDVEPGAIFGFLGPNGAGKSTTIRMLCGLLNSSAGTALVGGHDINREPERVRARIGYMSQKFSLYRDLTVRENIDFFGGVYGLEGVKLGERARAVIAMAGLEGLEDQLTGTLSGALQQRLALGCAILHEPPILFLDEPTSGVDPISRRVFWDLIQDMSARGVTVLVTTHFLDEAEYCHRIGFITAGKLVALDTPGAIKTAAVREDLFEVALPGFRGAREKLADLPGLAMSAYFGTRLHLFCEKGRYDAAQLRAAVTARGVEATSVEAVQPRLEDAFIRLVQREANGGGTS